MTGTTSKGCATCRRRSVKCDKTKPVCARCRAANYECSGYGPTIAFATDWNNRDDKTTLQTQRVKRLVGLVEASRDLDEGTSSPHRPLSTDISRQEMYLNFFVGKLLARRKAGDLQNWYLLKLRDLRQSSSTAIAALSTYFFGCYHHCAEITRQGILFYGQAIAQLRGDLEGPEAFKVSTLIATSLLVSYELIGSHPHDGWIHHAGGLARLVEARGPTSHMTGTAKAIFLEQRTVMISAAVLQRKRTFLSRPQWKNVPWSKDPASKTPHDHLMDIAADGADYRVDIISTSVTGCSEGIEGYLRRLARTIDDLNAWWRLWAANVMGKVTEVPSDLSMSVIHDDNGPIFSSVFKWSDFWTCYVTIAYNATRIMLLQCHQQATDLAARYGLETTTLHEEPGLMNSFGIINDTKTLAFGILRCSEDLEARSKHFFGAFCLMLPFKFAQESLDFDSREARWLCSLPAKDLASYRYAADDLGSRTAMPVCGCMMIDNVVFNYDEADRTSAE